MEMGNNQLPKPIGNLFQENRISNFIIEVPYDGSDEDSVNVIFQEKQSVTSGFLNVFVNNILVTDQQDRESIFIELRDALDRDKLTNGSISVWALERILEKGLFQHFVSDGKSGMNYKVSHEAGGKWAVDAEIKIEIGFCGSAV